MTQRDPAAYAAAFQKNDALGGLLGCRLVSISNDACIYEYEARPEHFNPNGILHGGALFTAMDSSQGAFVHFFLEDAYRYASTGSAEIRYRAPVKSGKVTIRTTLKERKRKILRVLSVATDESGGEIAILEETWVAISA